MKSAGALSSRPRRSLTAAAIAATALALSGYTPAFAQTESAASAVWKTAAVASSPAAPTSTSPSPDSATANVMVTPPPDDYAPIAEVPARAPVPSPRAVAPASVSRLSNTGASNLMQTPPDPNYAPNASEIPSISDDTPVASTSASQQPPAEPNEITNYEQEQSGMLPEQLKNLQEYDSGSELFTTLGMRLREDRRALNTGEEADGLLITGLIKNSPAAEAGLHAYNAAGHNMMTGVAMAGAMLFPPAILLVPALDYTSIGETYDLIIGIDGARVRNFLDYQDRTRDLMPGEMIYLSVIRDGKRLQLTMTVPPNLTQATK
ncbi:MAG TPA: PDZ domain-containing protein [Candidatus Dormibacteraeota bacterium]|nr:PDZ domain-containing protein [Candidatus Dormibacteraeota bacterium]